MFVSRLGKEKRKTFFQCSDFSTLAEHNSENVRTSLHPHQFHILHRGNIPLYPCYYALLFSAHGVHIFTESVDYNDGSMVVEYTVGITKGQQRVGMVNII